MTKIPFFREARDGFALGRAEAARQLTPVPQVVLMAFECQHCGFRNSEVQMGGVIPDKGVHFELRVEKGDMKACGGWRKLNLVRAHASPSRSRAKLSRATRAPAGCAT